MLLKCRPLWPGSLLNSVARRQHVQPKTTPAASAAFSHVEVERKFVPSSLLKQYLMLVTPGTCLPGKPPWSQSLSTAEKSIVDEINRLDETTPTKFPSLTRLPDHLFHDSYFDKDATLSRQGIWIRERTYLAPHEDSILEAKARIAGDTVNSQFYESKGDAAVRALLATHLPNVPLESLTCIADIRTRRATWCCHSWSHWDSKNCRLEGLGPFWIFIDESDSIRKGAPVSSDRFRHTIGEVEMTRTMDNDASEHAEARQLVAKEMDEQVEKFITWYRQLFVTSPKPQGKLSAYFSWRESELQAPPGG